jgi:hypothetical protein
MTTELTPIPEHDDHDLESGLLRSQRKEKCIVNTYIAASILCILVLLGVIIAGFVIL